MAGLIGTTPRCEALVFRPNKTTKVAGRCVNKARASATIIGDKSGYDTMHVCRIHEKKLLGEHAITRVLAIEHRGTGNDVFAERVTLLDGDA